MSNRDKSNGSFVTTAQLATLMGVTAPTIIKWVRQGRIAATTTPGGHRRIATAEVERLLQESQVAKSALQANPKQVQRVLIVESEVDFADMVVEYLLL